MKMTNLEDEVNCSNRVYYTNKHYCSMGYAKGDCKYLNVMKTDIITHFDNFPVFAPKCSYLNDVINNWYIKDEE